MSEATVKHPAQSLRKKRHPGETQGRGFLRSNLEAFTVAIVMALIIKQFAFEAFQVPTESMEPSIIGRKVGGDRIIVDKTSYQIGKPERWDVMVFHYPLSQLVNYVKRLVGLPGEQVAIVHGDLYVKPAAGTQFKVARKKPALQDAIFRENPAIPLEQTKDFNISSLLDWWNLPDGGRQIQQGALKLEAGKSQIMVLSRGRITNERRDPHAHDRQGREDAKSPEPVGDLRLALTVTPDRNARALILTMTDCTQPRRPLRLELAVSGGGARSQLKFGRKIIEKQTLSHLTIPAGKESSIKFDNVDDALYLWIEGRLVLRHDYVQAQQRGPLGSSQVGFGLDRGQATFSRVALYRDLFYTRYPGTSPAPFRIPKGYYLFFGDNSPNSLDARGWRVVGIRLRKEGRILLGDMEAVSDELSAQRESSNPWLQPGDARHQFIDILGNHWRLKEGSYDILDLREFPDEQDVGIMKLHQTLLPRPRPKQIAFKAMSTAVLKEETAHSQAPFQIDSRLMHYVPAKNIVGQAYFVFWPISRWGIIR